ncbi:hypothetical protein [Breoghania sp. JC706]|uniref:hypothetical protein n=1 Tax=Breoghania sp. JC706 TaxID=3117732 RepID=UPI0030095511
MRISYLLMAAGLFSASAAAAGEVHIISRDEAGAFLSSHQIFQKDLARQQMTRVDYCGRSYYVYWNTIDWLDNQAYEGHSLGVEYSNGKTWRLICRNPEQQLAQVRDEARPKVQGAPDLPTDKKYGWIELLNKRSAR